jgi:hypothetical protein
MWIGLRSFHFFASMVTTVIERTPICDRRAGCILVKHGIWSSVLVFWGVTESRHLVDIVNQNDQVEDIDSEDKLGQPMINLNVYRSWGDLGLFLLPYFRERTFPASDARLRGPLPVAKDKAMFESRDGKENLDIALRWSHVIGNWDIGLAYFDGTSREPRLVPAPDEGGTPALIPFYDLIRQASADAQLTEGAWLWKLEALHRDGHGDRFSAAVVGFEHTTFGVRGTSADLGFLIGISVRRPKS